VLLRDGDRCHSHDAVIRVYDKTGNVIETHEHAGDFKKVMDFARLMPRFLLKLISYRL
jgi:hypothetical protein